MFDTVIFDLDGTLSDNSEGIIGSIRYALERLGRPMPGDNVVRRFIGPPLVMSFQRYCGMENTESLEALRLYRERYEVTGYLENRLYPGIRTLLTELKRRGAKLAVATGKPGQITESILEHFGILNLFDRVEGSTPEAVSSQKSELIRRILEKCPGNAVMIGDTQDDMAGAEEAGIAGIHVRYGFGGEWRPEDPGTASVRDVQELSMILLGEIPMAKGVFISLEGLDGCGKTTVSRHLDTMLRRYGYEVVHTREPGGCPISEDIRGLLLSTEHGEMTATAEALLYAASRYQHVNDVILPALRRGCAVICDRYVDSSLAYQGEGRQLGIDTIRAYNAKAMELCMPDITVYLRLDAETSLNRRLSESAPDRIEQEKRDFFERAMQGFDRLAREEPERYLTIDASQPVETVIGELSARLPEYMARGGFGA